MPKIIADIECGAKECGGCERQDYGACRIFESDGLEMTGEATFKYLRLPACIAAEKQLADLVEAARDVLLHHVSADLQAALAPFEEKP